MAKDDEIERLLKMGVRVLLSDRDVALMLGYKSSAMRQRRHRHPETLPPSIRIGKVHRYILEEVLAWIEQRRQGRALAA